MKPEERRPAGPGNRPAGPVTGDGGALRAGSSSTPPSPAPPAGDTPGQDDGGAKVEQDFEALLADTQRERDEYLELAKRTKADFENFRKRITADIQAAAGRGKAELARELVDPVDNLERALIARGIDPEIDPLGNDPAPDGGNQDEFVQGVNFVFRGLCETLRRHGIEVVNPKGERFDPNLHEALSTQAVDGTEAGMVVEVVQKGYRMGEQLIRPARVVVSG